MNSSTRIQDLFLAVVILLGTKFTPLIAQCTWLTVSGSAYTNTQLDGAYVLFTSCQNDGLSVWSEQYSGSNYIFYATTSSSNAEFQGPQNWAIGPFPCGGVANNYYAVTNTSSFFDSPFADGMAGIWHERNSTSGSFFPNPNLNVICSSYYSSSQTVGIVFGVLGGVWSVIGIIRLIFVIRRRRKERKTATDLQIANQVASNSNTGNPNVASNAGFRTESSEFEAANTGGMYGGLNTSVVQPPAYDNNALSKNNIQMID